MTTLKRVLAVGIVSALLLAFFYHLEYTALHSYDEAWYADVTRNLVNSGNPLRLVFNGMTFTDHPPFGFMLMAIPTMIFGSTEFSARFTSALLGAGSIILMYMCGRELKNRAVGLAAGGVLVSSLWFMLRARSGNLDVPFLFWSIFTFYWLLVAQNNVRFFYIAALGFSAMFLTKTLVGVGILPIFFYSLWLARHKLKPILLVKLLVGIVLIVSPWYVYNQSINSGFLYHHFLEVGARSEGTGFSLFAISKSLYYLQVGMGKWFKFFLLSVPVSILVWCFKKHERTSLSFVILYLVGFLPFFFSGSVEVWHLIPTYPSISLLIAKSLTTAAQSLFPKLKQIDWAVTVAILVIAAYQFHQMSNLLYYKTPQESAERDISKSAAHSQQVHVFETFYPAVVYYSGRTVIPMHTNPQAYQDMVKILQEGRGSIITNEDSVKALERDEVAYTAIARYQNYFLIE